MMGFVYAKAGAANKPAAGSPGSGWAKLQACTLLAGLGWAGTAAGKPGAGHSAEALASEGLGPFCVPWGSGATGRA